MQIEQDMVRQIYNDYDQILADNKRSFDRYIFSATPEINEQRACIVIRYCAEVYLRWTPEQLALRLNRRVVKHWGLTAVLKHIQYPKALHESANFWWVAHKCYPDRIVTSEKRVYLSVYEQVLNGNMDRWPRLFFAGKDRQKYIAGCLVYLLNTRRPLPMKKPADLYRFFASQGVTAFLRKYRLLPSVKLAFNNNPVDLIHVALGADADPYLYCYWRFTYLYNETLRQEAETRGAPRHDRQLRSPLADAIKAQQTKQAP